MRYGITRTSLSSPVKVVSPVRARRKEDDFRMRQSFRETSSSAASGRLLRRRYSNLLETVKRDGKPSGFP